MDWKRCWACVTECSGNWSWGGTVIAKDVVGMMGGDGDDDGDGVVDDSIHGRYSGLVCGLVV